ncbi:hypothetical protein [Dysgonomonas massiliensis]|uniref:hypothetical protein n=1 Tax=Dysgonomonas massiliensis TaxID=2040292 RepID=UPI000C77073B|nr:hypothetical protein [Dysgonomonas massiliensis]
MNIGDLLSNKIVQILIALFIGISLLVYKYDLLKVIWPEKSNIVAIDQNNKDIKIYDDTLTNKSLVDSLTIDESIGASKAE